jgi:hypothetical protein
LGTAVAAATSVQGEGPLPVQGVTGTLTLDRLADAGDFSVEQGVYQHRDVPMSASTFATDDPRLSGRLDVIWNWDVHSSGSQPVPAWGTMSIRPAEQGSWSGTFTGIRRNDFEPFMVRAFLIGEGTYDGLCAVLDIEAGPETWALDGVIHLLPMQA